MLRKLIEIQYERNDIAFERNRFRVRGDVVEIWPAYAENMAFRVEFFGDEIDRLCEINPLTGAATRDVQHVAIYPASHYVTTKEKMDRAVQEIEQELTSGSNGSRRMGNWSRPSALRSAPAMTSR